MRLTYFKNNVATFYTKKKSAFKTNHRFKKNQKE